MSTEAPLDFDIYIFEKTKEFFIAQIIPEITEQPDGVFATLAAVLGDINIHAICNEGYYKQFWQRFIVSSPHLKTRLLEESIHLRATVLSKERLGYLIDHLGSALSTHAPTDPDQATLDTTELERLASGGSTEEILTNNFWLVFVIMFYFSII